LCVSFAVQMNIVIVSLGQVVTCVLYIVISWIYSPNCAVLLYVFAFHKCFSCIISLFSRFPLWKTKHTHKKLHIMWC